MSEEIGETVEASGEVETTETVEASEPEVSAAPFFIPSGVHQYS